MKHYQGFAAPPARQALDLAGKPGANSNQFSVPLTRRLPSSRIPVAGDLPLTAIIRRNANPIGLACIVTGQVALLLFVGPLLVRGW